MTEYLAAPIVGEEWRKRAACADHPLPQLWEASVDGEPPYGAGNRHRAAIYVCKTRCPVRNECLAAVDWTWDEGVRGGVLLPRKKTASRRVPKQPREKPRRTDWAALFPCPECGKEIRYQSMLRHLRNLHGRGKG